MVYVLLLLNCDSPERCDSWMYPLSLLLLLSDTITTIHMLAEGLFFYLESLFTYCGFVLI